MVIDVPMEELLKKTGSIFKLCVVASQRTQELNEGCVPRVDAPRNTKTPTLALLEIASGKVEIVFPE